MGCNSIVQHIESYQLLRPKFLIGTHTQKKLSTCSKLVDVVIWDILIEKSTYCTRDRFIVKKKKKLPH